MTDDLWTVLGVSDEDRAEIEAQFHERMEQIAESERQAWIAAKDVWLR